MSIKIEEGKFYRRRDGKQSGRIERNHRGNVFPWWDPLHRRSYTNNGAFHPYRGTSEMDLVAEWVDEPSASAKSLAEHIRARLDGPAAEQPDIKAEIADEAKRIVSGARRSAYGKPEQNFERIARFWQAYFENTGRGAVNITAADVSPMMRLMKEARLCETPDHRDSFVDLVGYALTGAEVNGVKPA